MAEHEDASDGLISSGGRDPRRLFSRAERVSIAARQRHLCGVCQQPLPGTFHVHHVIPWIRGGPTSPENGMAVCPDCHHRAPIEDLPGFVPREWQREGTPRVLPILRRSGFATLAAAPGGANCARYAARTSISTRAPSG